MKVKNKNAMYLKKVYLGKYLINSYTVNYTGILEDIEPFNTVKCFKLNKYGYHNLIKVYDNGALMYEYEFKSVQGAKHDN